MKWTVFGPKSRVAMAIVTLIVGVAASSTAALADSGPMVYGPFSNSLEVRGEGFSSGGMVELYTDYRTWGGDAGWSYWKTVSAAPVRVSCTKPVGVCHVVDQGGWFTTHIVPGYEVTAFDCQTRRWAANKPIADVQPRCGTFFVPIFR